MNNLCVKRLVKIFVLFFFLENNEIKPMAVATQTIGLLVAMHKNMRYFLYEHLQASKC